MLSGQLHQLLALDKLGDSSVLRRREGSVCRLTAGGDHLRVLLGDRELRMPAALGPVMHRIVAQSGPFPLSALADELDEASRAVLVRRLVREGLLEIVTLG
jgi:hypothetical protein